ncbi:MAG TPA: TlyA family RNA methyltransferase [Solirubrobacterales bacterium]|nr:TlyA family RNA methyltransferase [Solirubrobacterales bacterium]
MIRSRLDTLIAERGLLPSRTAAATAIRAGQVRIGRGGEKALKPGQMVADDIRVEIEGGRRYASRGGLKLEAALAELGVDPGGRDCLDVGASTGGFTDCLLQRGAARVIALDVGRGQLDWSLRNDERVTVLEGVNARALEPADLPFRPSLVVVDVSFISLAKVLGPIRAAIADDGEVLAMVKPQFELGRGRVGKGGVVRSGGERREAVRSVIAAAAELGLAATGVAAAGVPGPKGNQEYFVRFAPGADHGDIDAEIERVVR